MGMVEREGFEPSVPLATVSLILGEEKGLQADPARASTELQIMVEGSAHQQRPSRRAVRLLRPAPA